MAYFIPAHSQRQSPRIALDLRCKTPNKSNTQSVGGTLTKQHCGSLWSKETRSFIPMQRYWDGWNICSFKETATKSVTNIWVIARSFFFLRYLLCWIPTQMWMQFFYIWTRTMRQTVLENIKFFWCKYAWTSRLFLFVWSFFRSGFWS